MRTKLTARKSTPQKTTRKAKKELTHTIYAYVLPVNGKFARTTGKKTCRSVSRYINSLIQKDRLAA